jgi:hypothetical protein
MTAFSVLAVFKPGKIPARKSMRMIQTILIAAIHCKHGCGCRDPFIHFIIR